jgi:hypothetical protein
LAPIGTKLLSQMKGQLFFSFCIAASLQMAMAQIELGAGEKFAVVNIYLLFHASRDKIKGVNIYLCSSAPKRGAIALFK